MKLDMIFRSVVGVAAIALAVLIVRESGLGTGIEDLEHWVDAEVRGRGLAGILLFVAAGALFTGVGLSRQVLAFAAGYAFGVAMGSGVALLAEIGGVALAFAYARFVGRDIVARRFPSRVRQVDRFLHANPFMTTLAVRLLPVSNNLVVNLVAGVSSVPAAPFLAASAVGHLPQTVVFALLGSGLATGIYLKSGLAIALLVVSIVMGLVLYRRYRRGQDFDPSAADLFDTPDVQAVPTGRPEA